MMALSCQGSMPERLTGCNILAKSTLPAESTHRRLPQNHGSLPSGTQGKYLEWKDNVERYLTIPDWGTVDLTADLAYILIWFDPDPAFWPV